MGGHSFTREPLVASIGSANLNARSAELDEEINIVKERVAGLLKHDM